MSSVASYRSSKVELKKGSKIAGRGIFAKEKINTNEIIAIKNGYIFNQKKFNKLPFECKIYCSQIDDNFFLGPKKITEIEQNAIFINHSCNPNVGIRGQIIFFAMRDINLNEELTLDYSTQFTKMIAMKNTKCKCGNINCRSIIRDSDWKLNKLQIKYGNNFSEYILRKI
ncbi:SET domain-containing protein-lysine N-methyltransferase [Candidatus Woesearchaeota archaeon]|jgi:uncharacterized protein|nr:SET domain-containing protein-lysine N-methyltransferase [Candidatus Woesearchaeota archaeon]